MAAKFNADFDECFAADWKLIHSVGKIIDKTVDFSLSIKYLVHWLSMKVPSILVEHLYYDTLSRQPFLFQIMF